MLSLATILAIGLLLGMRHATDPDHVVAVTTIVSRQRSLRGSMAVGALWGIGHTTTILLVGGAIILFKLAIPPRLGLAMELVVAVMLIVLGIANLLGRTPLRVDSAARPLVVGFIHGLAGSAAVALLVLTAIPDARWAAAYLLVFGAGTVAGMTAITVALSLPSLWATSRFDRAHRWLRLASGVASLAFGLFLAHRIGFVDGLFTGSVHWTPR